MTPELRQKYLDLLTSVEPDRALSMIISNMMREARDIGHRMEGGPDRMTEMMIVENLWLGMMREAGLRVVRDDVK